jgi:hypothetical protein
MFHNSYGAPIAAHHLHWGTQFTVFCSSTSILMNVHS